MAHGYSLGTEVHPTSAVSWDNQPAHAAIEDISALNLGNGVRLVSQGGHVEVGPGSGVTEVVSDGFSRCSALILRESTSGNLAFAHVQPFDDHLYATLEAIHGGYDEGLLVYGAISTWQRDIELLLEKSGLSVHRIEGETGNGHFGVALDTSNGQVALVRKVPTQSILHYEPFGAIPIQ